MSNAQYGPITVGSTMSNTLHIPGSAMNGLIRVDVVKTAAGFIGQIVVNGEIAWESAPKKTSEKAVKAASDRGTNKLKELFQ